MSAVVDSLQSLSPAMKMFFKGADILREINVGLQIIGIASYSRTAYAKKHNSNYLTPSYYISPSQNLEWNKPTY